MERRQVVSLALALVAGGILLSVVRAQTPVSELEDLRDVLQEWQTARLPLDGTNWFPAGAFVLSSADGGLGAVAEGAVPSPEGCWRLYVTEDSRTGETLFSDALGLPLATLPGDGPSADQGGPWDPSRVGISLDLLSTNMSTAVEIPAWVSRTDGFRTAVSTRSAGDSDSPGNGVVLHYDFDVAPTGGIVPDRSGNGYDGVAAGCEWTAGGRFNGGAMAFDDNGDSINVGTGLDFPAWSRYSVSVWFRHDGGGDMGPQYGHKMLDKTTWYHDWHLHLSPPNQEGGTSTGGIGLTIYEGGVGGGLGDNSVNYADDEWHHVVVVRDGGHGEFWVDGVLRDQTEGMFSVYSSSELCVGNSYSGDYYQRKAWHGSLDEIRVFDRALAADEIQSLHLLGVLVHLDGDDDGDGLTGAREWELGTDPLNPDTDGDGLRDGEEVGFIAVTNGLPWLEFDSPESSMQSFSYDGYYINLQLTTPICVQGFSVTNVLMGWYGDVLFCKAGVAPVYNVEEYGWGDDEWWSWWDFSPCFANSLEVLPYGGINEKGEGYCVRAGLATYGGESFLLVEYDDVVVAWPRERMSCQMAIPMTRPDRAYVRWRWDGDPVSEWPPYMDVGFTGMDGKSSAWLDGANVVLDSDGFAFLMVFGHGSNPTLADTDGDGLRDDEEALVRQTLPYVVDTDGDGLSDFGEVRIYGTNPRLADTDGDGRTDGEEILMTPATDPLDPDTDHDGLPDGWEVRHGLNPLSDVDGAGVDTDGDGLSNGRELALGTSPALRDTDGDGLEDADEVVRGTSPMLSDTDGDGRSDWDEIFGTPATDPLDPDTDHDGLPDGWEVRHGLDPLSTADGASADTDGDGIPNLAELCLGLDPRGVSTEAGFEVYEDGMSANVGAWEVLPCAFSFDRPAALTNIVERTFRVDRASPWQQLFISSTLLEQDMATGQGGWNSSGIAIQYSLDGGTFEGAIPGTEWTTWRIPLGMRIVTNMTVRIVAQGRHPFLETGLYLLRWAPRLVVGESEDVRILDDGVQSPVVAVRRNAESAGYRMSVTLDFSGFPAFYGSGFWDEMPWDEFRAPPVPGVVVESDFDSWSTDVVLCAEDPLWAELPFGRTNSVVRLCCWEVVKNDAGAISSGPRSSPYRGAYPLSSEADRRAFHRAETTSPVAAAEYAAFPVDAPLEIVGRGGRSAAVRARRASSVPTSCGCPETCNGCIGLEIGGMYCSCVCLDHEDRSDEGRQLVPWESDTEEPEEDECPCGKNDEDSHSSFHLRVSLGETESDGLYGYVWTSLEGPAMVTPAVFGVLGAAGVSSTTNSAGEFTVTSSRPGGRTVALTRIEHGVSIEVTNASGRFEYRWDVWNESGRTDVVRARRLTVSGNATVDARYNLRDEMGYGGEIPDGSRVRGVEPSERSVREDVLRNVQTVKRKWFDPDEPDFATDVFDETYLGWTDRAAAVMSEFAKLGEGAFACRRLARRFGYDESGAVDETRTYWCDGRHPLRHGRLRSLRSNREPWRFCDYDELGRETVRLEQLDGSPFPGDVENVSPLAELPAGCSARAVVTSYAPGMDDSAHRNDRDLPRRREEYVLRGGMPPLLVRTETWTYSRSSIGGVPVRTRSHASVYGADAARPPAIDVLTEYPEGDYAVPTHLRGRAVSVTDVDGVTASTAWERGTWDAEARGFSPTASGAYLRATTRRSRGDAADQTYAVEVSELSRRLVVHSETRLTADDAVLEWTSSAYDDVDRLRSRHYSDGSSETNDYSCCRLLWSRDRRGRKVLRSARTGSDDLYHAEEEVWLADISTNGAFRVTQHFADGLGRETDTVTYVADEPGEACDPVTPDESRRPASLGRRSYGVDDDWDLGTVSRMESVDSRGRRDVTCVAEREECTVTRTETDDVDDCWSGISGVLTTSYRNGATVTERNFWGDSSWTCRVRRSDWDADGLRRDVDWTESYDYGVVTNSITRHDSFGRVASVWTPLGETVNEYDGPSSRLLASTVTSSGGIVRVTRNLHDEMGERIGTVVDGVTNRVDVGYELRDGFHWRVTTTSETGPETNAVSVVRERLDGLSDDLRAFTVAVGPDGVVSTNMVSHDPRTGIETSTTTSSVGTPVVARSRCGVSIEASTVEEKTVNSHDAFGRVVKIERRNGVDAALLPVSEDFYDAVGDLVSRTVYTNGADVVAEDYQYDFKGRRISVVNALGNETVTEYDVCDRVVHVYGATYPVWYEYDSQDRRVALWTVRDEEHWQLDATRWTLDGATGLCTRKTYADGSHVDYTYTGDGKPLRTTWPDGRWKECVYDARRRSCGMVYSSPDMDYDLQRDAYGNVTNAADAAGNAWTYVHDANSVPRGETWVMAGGTPSVASTTNELSRSVDAFQRPTGYALAVDGVGKGGVGYAYDAENRICGVAATNAAGRSFMVSYMNNAGYNYGYTVTMPNGGVLRRVVERDPFRRGLVTGCSTYYGGMPVDSYAYAYDAGGRPVSRNGDSFGYDARDQVTYAAIGTNVFTHAYDGIGNHVLSGVNAETNHIINNGLNQTTAFAVEEITWNANGGMASDAHWNYAYDAEDRLVSATSRALTNGAVRVRNAYDWRSRRISKVVDRYDADAEEWRSTERRDFVWDGWNIVHETVAIVNGATTNVTEIQYFWGPDLSGSLQGAGGVGGLLAVSCNGSFHFPCYDNNGNVMKYVDETGMVVASYVYDDFGRVISQSGSFADTFAFGFSTKYFDRETGLVAYQRRFYRPDDRCWLNRDPIEENGGENLYAFCANAVSFKYDKDGCAYFALRPLAGAPWLGLASHNFLDDLLNTEIAHEHLFFEDGKSPSDYGLHGDIGQDGKQVFHGEDSSRYRHFERGYNDCVMRIAVANVKPKPYSVLGSLKASKYNCQDYCSDLRREYFRLLFDNSVRKKCCIGSKDRK